jgi:Tfp pilus assembly protein PilN
MANAVLNRTAAGFRDSATRFLDWWRGALLDGLPPAAQGWLAATSNELVCRVQDPGAVVERRQGDKVAARKEIASTAQLAAAMTPVMTRGDGDLRVVVELPQAQALRRSLEWPLQAEANLRNAISYQLENLVPLPADALYFDFVVRRRRPDAGLVEFELVTVPRDSADPWLEAFADQAGTAVDALTVAGIDGSVNLLPADRRPRARNRRGLWAKVLAGIVVVLLGIALVLPVQQKKQELALLEREIAAFSDEAEIVRALREELGAEVAAVQEVATQRSRMQSRLAVVEALARSLPDDAYLMALQIDGTEMKVTGEAPSSVAIVESLSAVEELAQVDFAASVTRSSRTGKERFQLKITLKEPAVAGND